MKSRKKVSRKKAAPHKTRSRRSRVRTNRRTKRGGMIRSVRTLFYHDILPLLSRARLNIYLGREPTPDEYAITKENDRYYGTILDIPVDNGIKNSIEELRKELEHPVKTADKMKSIKEKYDAIIKKLDEEKKKQHAKQARELMVVGKPFTPPPTPVLSATVVGSSSTPNSKSARSSAISSLVNPPFSTPRQPDYSTNKPEPDTLPSKGEIRPPGQSLGEGTPLKNPFNKGEPLINSPYFSPPPPDQAANKENQNPNLLLSPGPTPVRMLTFVDDDKV